MALIVIPGNMWFIFARQTDESMPPDKVVKIPPWFFSAQYKTHSWIALSNIASNFRKLHLLPAAITGSFTASRHPFTLFFIFTPFYLTIEYFLPFNSVIFIVKGL